MALTYKNVADIINQQIMKNATGDNNGIIIAEDLNNLVEVAKVVNSSSVPDMRNAVQNLVVGVHNYILSRMVEEKGFKMFRDAISYGGALQRIMSTGFFDAMESHILNLQNGVDYTDGTFHGSELSASTVEHTDTFKVAYSVAQDFYSTWWDNAEDLVRWMNEVANKERNTIRKQLNELEQRVINMSIVNCLKADTPRQIKLLTLFNAKEGRTGNDTPTLTNDSKWTLTELQKYRDEWAYFGSFCKSVIARLIDYVKAPSKKYNDGTVLTWTPTEKVGIVMLSQFSNEIEYLGTPVEFNPKGFTVDYQTVDTWQNLGTDMLPDYSVTGTIEVVNGESSDMYGNIVGLVYDADGLGVCNVLSKATTKDVGEEGFYTIYNHQANKYFVDPRLSAVAITLD